MSKKSKKAYGWEDDETEEQIPKIASTLSKKTEDHKKPEVVPSPPIKKESKFTFMQKPAEPIKPKPNPEIMLHESSGYFHI